MKHSLPATLSAYASVDPLAGEPALVQPTSLVMLLALENAKLSTAWQESLRQLADARARIIEASDVARRRLERDLHDGAQQRLTTIQVMLRLAQEEAQDQDLSRRLESICEEAARAVDELRALARGIYPAVLRDHGLVHALRALARETPVPVRVIDKGIGRCPEPVEAAVYFCVLEAIQNASKHAGANARVNVLLARDRHGVRFEVADDGVGMDVESQGDGVGMISMRDRIGAVAGELDVRSSPGRGTRVRGTVPDDRRVSLRALGHPADQRFLGTAA